VVRFIPPLLLMFGKTAFDKLKEYDFKAVLDIGSGNGGHSKLFQGVGKKVTSIDIRTTGQDYLDTIVKKHDCAWCCHVLEHQPNVNMFLKKISNDVIDGGLIAITVPPRKDEIVGGHISLWNAGLLVYNLVMAGIDCSECQIRSQGYDVSVIVRNNKFVLPNNLYSDTNELVILKKYLPSCVKDHKTGVIGNHNWNRKI